MKSRMEFRRIIQATCCVPALEEQKAAIALKAGKTFSQTTHIHTHVPKPTAPYITMIKHSDQTRANPSFINVTADVVAKKGLPVPLLPGQWMQHLATLLLVTATLSINHWEERESTAGQRSQTRTRKHLRNRCGYQCADVQISVQSSINRQQINLQFAVKIKTGHCSLCQHCSCRKKVTTKKRTLSNIKTWN